MSFEYILHEIAQKLPFVSIKIKHIIRVKKTNIILMSIIFKDLAKFREYNFNESTFQGFLQHFR